MTERVQRLEGTIGKLVGGLIFSTFVLPAVTALATYMLAKK